MLLPRPAAALPRRGRRSRGGMSATHTSISISISISITYLFAYICLRHVRMYVSVHTVSFQNFEFVFAA